jgi:acetamidase/formamidase
MGTKWLSLALMLAATAAAETHQIVAKSYYRTFDHRHPVLQRIKPGDVVVTKTLDANGIDFNGERQHPEPGNPLTGPFYIDGAQPGDALVVVFRKMRLNRKWGYSGYRLGLFALTPEYIETAYPNKYKPDVVIKGRSNVVPWDLDLTRNTVRLREPKSQRTKLEFPAKPMLGCVGLAPAGDFAPTSGPSGSYGGNLDYNQIGEGARVILPVSHPGATLFSGDAHASQGGGEPTGKGIETSMDVEFTTEIIKKARVSGPRVETPTHIISIGSQPEFSSDLNRALQMATVDMVHWLTDEYKLEPWAAHLLISFQGNYDVITVAGSMGLKLRKDLLPAR